MKLLVEERAFPPPAELPDGMTRQREKKIGLTGNDFTMFVKFQRSPRCLQTRVSLRIRQCRHCFL